MGFLDFLKKDKPAPQITPDTVPMPPPPGLSLPADPGQIDWNAPPRMDAPQPLDAQRIDAPRMDLPPKPEGALPTGSMYATPLRRNPLPSNLDHDDDFEHVPLPPVSMQDPDFLESAAEDLNPKRQETVEKTVSRLMDAPENPFGPSAAPPPMPAPVSSPPSVPAPTAQPQKIELPDFTDEEISEWAKPPVLAPADLPPVPQPVQKAAPPAQEPMQPPKAPTLEIVTEEPIVEPPANAVAIPPEEFRLPTGEDLDLEKVEPAKFLSSGSYFSVIADFKAMRKALRQNDDVIKDATLRHEQLDVQYKRVAADINAVQELFMKMDGALFEE